MECKCFLGLYLSVKWDNDIQAVWTFLLANVFKSVQQTRFVVLIKEYSEQGVICSDPRRVRGGSQEAGLFELSPDGEQDMKHQRKIRRHSRQGELPQQRPRGLYSSPNSSKFQLISPGRLISLSSHLFNAEGQTHDTLTHTIQHWLLMFPAMCCPGLPGECQGIRRQLFSPLTYLICCFIMNLFICSTNISQGPPPCQVRCWYPTSGHASCTGGAHGLMGRTDENNPC